MLHLADRDCGISLSLVLRFKILFCREAEVSAMLRSPSDSHRNTPRPQSFITFSESWKTVIGLEKAIIPALQPLFTIHSGRKGNALNEG